MLSIWALVQLGSALISLAVGLYIYFDNPHNKTVLCFLLLSFFSFVSSIAEFNFQSAVNFDDARLWGSILYFWLLMPVFFLLFYLIFSSKFEKRRPLFWGLSVFFTCSFLINFVTQMFSGIPHRESWGWALIEQAEYGILTYIPEMISLWMYLCCCVILALRYLEAHGPEKKLRIQLVGVSFALVALFLLGDLVFPELYISRYFAVVTTVQVVVIAYGMIKYATFTLNPISASEKIIETMNDMLFLIDKDGKILEVNNSVEKYLGYSEEDLTGRKMEDILKGESDLSLTEFLRSGPEGKEILDVESQLETRHDQNIDVSISAAAIIDDDGERAGSVLIARDIRERLKREENIDKRLEELQRMNRLFSGREKKINELKEEIKSMKKN